VTKVLPPAHPFDYAGDGSDDDKLKEECGVFGTVDVFSAVLSAAVAGLAGSLLARVSAPVGVALPESAAVGFCAGAVPGFGAVSGVVLSGAVSPVFVLPVLPLEEVGRATSAVLSVGIDAGEQSRQA
jgi:branched-subunit amino acid ABC-type transport system permease component